MEKENSTTKMNSICSHCINQEACLSNSDKKEDCLGCPDKEDCLDCLNKEGNSDNTTKTKHEIKSHTCTGADCVFCNTIYGSFDKPSNKQVGGNHYQGFKIQPKEFFLANNLPFFESSVIKYVCRYKKKDGKKDLLKAIHCCEILIEEYYG